MQSNTGEHDIRQSKKHQCIDKSLGSHIGTGAAMPTVFSWKVSVLMDLIQIMTNDPSCGNVIFFLQHNNTHETCHLTDLTLSKTLTVN